ncbi:hypothetical protein GC173_08530 [bacterium]|nr:hypothetical protein [bacterium]
MKYIATLLIVVALVIGAFWWLGQYQEKNPGPPPPRSPQPTPAPFLQRIQSMAPVVTPTPAPVRRTQGYAPAAAPAAVSNRPKVEAAARQSNVRIVSFNEVGGTMTVSLEWISDNATQGGDFLDAMIRLGMRDFDELGKGQVNRGGRRVFVATYRLKM